MAQDYGRGGGPVSTGAGAAAKGAAKGAGALVKVTAKTIASLKSIRKK